MSSDEDSSNEKRIDEDQLLKDPMAKAALLKKMGLDGPEKGEESQRPTPSIASGTSSGVWPSYPPPFWSGLYPPFPIGRQPVPTWTDGRGAQGRWVGMTPEESDADSSDAGPSAKRPRIQEEEEDMIDLLDESEALEMVEFDPKVKPADTWEPPQSICSFLNKHCYSGFSLQCQEIQQLN